MLRTNLNDDTESVLSVLRCSSAVLDPTVGHTTDVLSPFISVLCHSDWLFHGESCPRLDVVQPKPQAPNPTAVISGRGRCVRGGKCAVRYTALPVCRLQCSVALSLSRQSMRPRLRLFRSTRKLNGNNSGTDSAADERRDAT